MGVVGCWRDLQRKQQWGPLSWPVTLHPPATAARGGGGLGRAQHPKMLCGVQVFLPVCQALPTITPVVLTKPPLCCRACALAGATASTTLLIPAFLPTDASCGPAALLPLQAPPRSPRC